MAKITNILGSLFLLLILVHLIPPMIHMGKNYYDEAFNLKSKVGVINLQGEINNAGSYIKNIKSFFENDSIKAILLRIESPGGNAGSGQVIFNEILAYKKEYPKPVVTLVYDVCASNAYYIACASDHIITSPLALVGSIGSYLLVGLKLKELIEKYGVRYEVIQSGKYKMALNRFTDTTPEVNAMLQSISDDAYNQFKKDVAVRRKLSLNDADKWANGKIFTGRQAFELGLVDELGSEYNAIKKIRELALIEKDKKIDWVKAPGPSIFERFMGAEDEGVSSKSFMELFIDTVATKITCLAAPKMQ
ncbi:MAG: signal peptide peptidase SppA [Candidatus Babeliales bacterium]|nr:signal peptide peptidase SppA [Candidatus Babeliales bacterium]